MSPKDQAKLAALRAAAHIGFDDIEAGRYVEFKSAKELRDYLERDPIRLKHILSS
jgi:hypothetical protein